MEKVEASSPILENPSHREKLAPMNSSEEPAEDVVHRESEGNAYTRLGGQVKPVQKDSMYS